MTAICRPFVQTFPQKFVNLVDQSKIHVSACDHLTKCVTILYVRLLTFLCPSLLYFKETTNFLYNVILVSQSIACIDVLFLGLGALLVKRSSSELLCNKKYFGGGNRKWLYCTRELFQA